MRNNAIWKAIVMKIWKPNRKCNNNQYETNSMKEKVSIWKQYENVIMKRKWPMTKIMKKKSIEENNENEKQQWKLKTNQWQKWKVAWRSINEK